MVLTRLPCRPTYLSFLLWARAFSEIYVLINSRIRPLVDGATRPAHAHSFDRECGAQPTDDAWIIRRKIAAITSHSSPKALALRNDDLHPRSQHVPLSFVVNQTQSQPMVSIADLIYK